VIAQFLLKDCCHCGEIFVGLGKWVFGAVGVAPLDQGRDRIIAINQYIVQYPLIQIYTKAEIDSSFVRLAVDLGGRSVSPVTKIA
jgi:hypothetical protein